MRLGQSHNLFIVLIVRQRHLMVDGILQFHQLLLPLLNCAEWDDEIEFLTVPISVPFSREIEFLGNVEFINHPTSFLSYLKSLAIVII